MSEGDGALPPLQGRELAPQAGGGGPIERAPTPDAAQGSPHPVASAPPSPEGEAEDFRSLAGIRSWIFDMDDTLYPREQGVMALVQARINAFMIDAVGLPEAEAQVLQRQFLNEHGTTLAGLMANYAVDSDRFLREVHDVPLDGLEPSPRLVEVIAALPGQTFVLTNGARCHAARVLERIGFLDGFDGVFCIEDMELVPKPAPATFRRFLDRFDIDPANAAFFEDTPRNLMPAKTLGMTTVLIGDGHGHEIGDWIDHRADTLLDFLTPLTLRDAA